MSSEIVVFITGAGSGIGKGLIEHYIRKPNHIVIGIVRDAGNAKYDALKKSTAAEGSRLIIVNIDSANLEGPATAVKAAEAAGVTKIDIVIDNAGISPPPDPPNNVPITDISEAVNINTLSPVALYKATQPLMAKSEKPKWLSVRSATGSITNLEIYQDHYILAYGVAKAALKFLTIALHSSQANLIAYAIHPGHVQTDLGNTGAKIQGLEKAPITLDDCCTKIIASLDNATREKTSGKFIHVVDGEELPW